MTSTTDALSGQALDPTTEVLATLDIDIGPAARATLERMLALDPRHRALATERTNERVAVSRITARITDAGNYVTRHTIAWATPERAMLEREDDGRPSWANPRAPRHARHAQQIAIELKTEDGSTISLDTDLAVLATWGAGVRTTTVAGTSTIDVETVAPWGEGVRTTTVALTRTSTINVETLAGILDRALVEDHVEAAIETMNEDARIDHREAAERHAARLVASSTREGDAAALKLLAETVCLGAISAGEETENTTYTIVIRPPHAGAKDIDVRAETTDGSHNGETEYEVTAEQHTREEATLRVRAPDATTAMHRAQREVERDGADWHEIENDDGTVRMTAARASSTQRPAR